MKNITLKKFILIALTALFAFFPVSAQTDSIKSSRMQMKNSEGKEFWLCFMKNYMEESNNKSGNKLMLELFITADKSSRVTIEIKSLGFKKTIDVPGGTIENVKIDPRAETKSYEISEVAMGVHVTSDNPVTVYGLNHRFQTTDTYLALPVEVLGTEYRVMCYYMSEPLMPEFSVIATEDNTIVEISPTVETDRGRKANQPFTVTLNKGDVYQVTSKLARLDRLKCDLTGSLVKANKKIAVFSGHMCAFVPTPPPVILACNHLVEQIPPINTWGKHFFVGRFEKRSFFTYRVLAHFPNTKVFLNSQLLQTLQPGEFLEKAIDRSIQITADKPVLVSQYSQGFNNKDSIGDPMMILVSPTQQFLKKYRVATPINGDWNHYLNVVVPTIAIKTFKLNSKTIDTARFTPLGISRYSIALFKVPYGSHSVECDMPFGLYSYGFGYGVDAFDAYGNMGGQSFVEYEPAKDSLPPMAELKYGKTSKLIFRDDRVDDAGLKDFKILECSGIDPVYTPIVEGQPQLSVDLNPLSNSGQGRMLVEIKDAALNSRIFTVCYSVDPRTGDFSFGLNEGNKTACVPDPGWLIGGFLKYSILFHNPSFGTSGGLFSKGKYSDAIGSGGYFGFVVSREVKPGIFATGRLSLENYGGTLVAPDSVITQIRDTKTGQLRPFQESTNLSLNGVAVNLSASGEYHFKSRLYALAGLNLALTLSKSADYSKKIIQPNDFTYSDGTKERIPSGTPDALNSLNTVRFGGFFGLGFSYPITFRLNGFAETVYAKQFGSMISDGSWNLSQLSFMFGVKYRI